MGFAASMVLWRGTAVARESTRARAVKERDKDRASENRGPRRRERERETERERGGGGERGYKRIGDERRRRNRDRGG